jgi:hypothetical protein
MNLQDILLLLGIGFLAANIRVAFDFLRFLKRRSSALLVWLPPRPPFYGMLIAIGLIMGILIVYNVSLSPLRSVRQLFGEAMMFVYYTAAIEMKRAIARGFYADGIWAEGGFVPYQKIAAISWREDTEVTLLMTARFRHFARRLVVPGNLYGAARRLLRDKIKAHDIRFNQSGLDLGLGETDGSDRA